MYDNDGDLSAQHHFGGTLHWLGFIYWVKNLLLIKISKYTEKLAIRKFWILSILAPADWDGSSDYLAQSKLLTKERNEF